MCVVCKKCSIVGTQAILLKYVVLESVRICGGERGAASVLQYRAPRRLDFSVQLWFEGANLALDNKNYSQSLAGIEFQPKSYACNCQTPGAFDRFFMPFDVTFEKIQSENGNYWNSVESQSLAESSKTSTSPNSLKTARLFDKTSSTCRGQPLKKNTLFYRKFNFYE